MIHRSESRLDTMRYRLLLLSLLTLLSACGPQVVSVESLKEFPAPLIEPMPVRVGVHYPPEFMNYSHSEKRPGPAGQEWNITLGQPQVQVFRSIFGSLFRQVEELDSAQAPPSSGLAAVVVPTISEFQFALPRETRAKVFEIWVKYDLGIYAPDGGELGHWQFTAYGKTPSAFMTSDGDAVRAASIVALRDAGASLISGVERDPRIREWLGLSAQAPSPTIEAKPD